MTTNFVGNVQAIASPEANVLSNRIINGSMTHDQRSEGDWNVVGTPLGTTTNVYTCDRMVWSVTKAAAGAVGANDQIQTRRIPQGEVETLGNSSVPAELKPFGYFNRFYFLSDAGGAGTNTFAGGGAGQQVIFSQLIEGDLFNDLGWGTSGGKSITVSFYYSILTGATSRPAYRFNIFVRNEAGTQVYRVPVDVPAYNYDPSNPSFNQFYPWRRAVASIPPPPTGSDWNGYMRVGFCFFDRTATTDTTNAWDSVSTSYGLTSLNALPLFLQGAFNVSYGDFFFTGLQVEDGGVTPFQWRPRFMELDLCRRYYQKSYNPGVKPATNTSVSAFNWTATSIIAGTNQYTLNYPVTLRTAGIVTIYTPAGVAGSVTDNGAANRAVVTENQGIDRTSLYLTVAAGAVGNWLRGHYVANAEYI